MLATGQIHADDAAVYTNASVRGAVTRENPRAVGRWLIAFAIMIFAIIVVGGATRLTESGLSITEWKPVSGVIPPMSESRNTSTSTRP